MSKSRKEITPMQDKILLMLLSGSRITDIVEALGIARNTYYSITRTDEFISEYRKRKAENFEAAFTRIQSSLFSDVKLLEDIRDDETESSVTRMKAVKLLLEHSVNAYEREQLEIRISEIEKKLGIVSTFRT